MILSTRNTRSAVNTLSYWPARLIVLLSPMMISTPVLAEIVTFPTEPDPHLYLHERVSGPAEQAAGVRLRRPVSGERAIEVEVSELRGDWFVSRGPFRLSDDEVLNVLDRAGIATASLRLPGAPGADRLVPAALCTGLALTGGGLAMWGETLGTRNIGRGMLIPVGLWALHLGWAWFQERHDGGRLDPVAVHGAIASYNRKLDAGNAAIPSPPGPEGLP